MPKYRLHLLPEDGLEDLELRFADDLAAMRTAEVILQDQARARRDRGGSNLTKVIEIIRSDGTSVGFAKPRNNPLKAAYATFAKFNEPQTSGAS